MQALCMLASNISWGQTIKYVLLALATVILCVAVVLLVVEIIGKRKKPNVVVHKTEKENVVDFPTIEEPAVEPQPLPEAAREFVEVPVLAEEQCAKSAEEQEEQSVAQTEAETAESAIAETEEVIQDVPENVDLTEEITVTDDGPLTESITENITEDTTESITEDTTENITESITEDITESIAEENAEDGTESDESSQADMESFDVGGKKIWIRFSRSFTAKLIQADDTLKARYSELKNELIAYGAKDRMSWSNESFRKGRKTIAKFAIRGKTLSLYLALEPAAYKDTKYFYEDSSGVAKYAGVPMRLRLRSDRSVRWAKELIADLLASYGLQKQEIAAVDYAAWSPYESTDDLIARGLIRVFEQNFEPNFEQGGAQKPKEVEVSADEFMELRREKLREVAGKEVQERTTVAEADASITDEAANALIEREIVRVREDKRKKKKRGIVNLDTISKYFNAGETVTFEKLNEARLVPKGVNYIKVLARGELDKPLRIIADEFSLPAVKMIVLTSGSAAVRTEVVE